MRGKLEYLEALHRFYHEGNKLDFDQLDAAAQGAINEYWSFIEFLVRRYPIIRLQYADDPDARTEKLKELDGQRDKRHLIAASLLMGRSLEGGISDGMFNDVVRIGRQLVGLM